MSHSPDPRPWRQETLPPGLYLVATPIGSLRDITLRALDILASADVILAEDTRNTRHLLDLYGIALGGRPLIPYHDHNGAAQRPRVLEMLRAGRSVALCSDAGTPLVADPGYPLTRAVIEAGLALTAAPGPSALLAALSVAGQPTDRFLFAGFPPAAAGARARWLAGLAGVEATLVLYDSPRRLGRLLAEMEQSFGPDRPAAICRELTKRFEQVLRGPLGTLAQSVADMPQKGEAVVVIGPPPDRAPDAETLDQALTRALASGIPLREAAAEVAQNLGLPRRAVYQRALALRDGGQAP